MNIQWLIQTKGMSEMKKALIVIDVQAGMYTAGIPVHNGEKFLETL